MKLLRIMLAATSSGSGKTLITSGILQALVNRGYQVASFKCGPDYIDPMFHSRVIGTQSGNLDTFFTEWDTTRYLFMREAAKAEVSVVEGVMGYYDGVGGVSTKASSFELARVLDMPVVLIVNCQGMSLSIAAQIKGFLEFERPSRIKGVILNRIPASMYQPIKEQIEARMNVQVLGYVPKLPELALKSRHLGLVMPDEVEDLRGKLNQLAAVLEETLDLDAFMAMAFGARDLDCIEPKIPKLRGKKKVHLALARDEAFCFTYRDNLQLLEEMGAVLEEFSPLHDKGLPKGIQGIILSGGYPELHARALSENQSMREEIGQAVKNGLPCIAECGGFLYLHRTLEGEDGNTYPMAGVLEAKAYRTSKLSRFGYATLEAKEDQLLLEKGATIRGHEFHYWESESCGDSMRAEKPMRGTSWECVHGSETLYAGFPHLFFYSNPKAALRFLKKCKETPCLR